VQQGLEASVDIHRNNNLCKHKPGGDYSVFFVITVIFLLVMNL